MNRFVNNNNNNSNETIDEDELLMCNSFLEQIENKTKSNFKLSSSDITISHESSLSSTKKILIDTSNFNNKLINNDNNKNSLNNSITSKILNDKLSASKSSETTKSNLFNHVILFAFFFYLCFYFLKIYI
jgi:hypothetical protein